MSRECLHGKRRQGAPVEVIVRFWWFIEELHVLGVWADLQVKGEGTVGKKRQIERKSVWEAHGGRQLYVLFPKDWSSSTLCLHSSDGPVCFPWCGEKPHHTTVGCICGLTLVAQKCPPWMNPVRPPPFGGSPLRAEGLLTTPKRCTVGRSMCAWSVCLSPHGGGLFKTWDVQQHPVAPLDVTGEETGCGSKSPSQPHNWEKLESLGVS